MNRVKYTNKNAKYQYDDISLTFYHWPVLLDLMTLQI